MKAWLITNEFLNTTKFTELTTWLINSAKKHKVQMEVITNAEVLAVVGGSEKKKDDIDFVLFWDKDVRLAAYLESLGYRVYNSSEAIDDCDDKSRTHLKLFKAGLPMPKTIIAPMTYPNIGYTNYEFVRRVENELGYPMVVKEITV